MGEVKEVLMEDVQIIFRNFEGKEGMYNRAGDRNFGILLDEKTALDMLDDGWNIKYLKPRDEEDDEDRPWLPVSVSFKNRPPNIYLLAGGNRTRLDEDTCALLDVVDIKMVDLLINPYTWEVNGKGGIKAYLKSIFVTINEDPLEKKYKIYEDPPAAED